VEKREGVGKYGEKHICKTEGSGEGCMGPGTKRINQIETPPRGKVGGGCTNYCNREDAESKPYLTHDALAADNVLFSFKKSV
jgi:hypothetical protein